MNPEILPVISAFFSDRASGCSRAPSGWLLVVSLLSLSGCSLRLPVASSGQAGLSFFWISLKSLSQL
jgi:hypothetical protein